MQMYEGGFVKIHRSILNWDWYSDINTKALFLHLILTANYMPGNYKGTPIDVGQRAVSLAKLASEMNLTIKQIRTCLKHLERTGEVTCTANNQCTVITVNNYVSFQSGASEKAYNMARNRASTGQGKGTQGANLHYKKKGRKEEYARARHVSSFEAERPGAIGGDGDWYIEVDGIWHRFPESWFGFAEKNDVDIAEYVKGRHQ